MYEAFYGLIEKPFNLLPDPEFLYMSKSHDNAYAHLEYAISDNKGFVVVTGEIGAGKTTLINFLLSKIPQDINIGLINNTFIPSNQILRVICQEFEVDSINKDKVQLLEAFHEFLLKQFSLDKRVVLFIDEAQNLSPASLEEVRLLSNLESEKKHLIQIILVGQPELKLKLQRKDLKQFAQRVSVHCHLKGLDNGEVQQYIRHRLKAAGSEKENLFEKEAIDLISRYSKGIPRLINILCDTALIYGYADSKKKISVDIVESVIEAREAGGILTDVDGKQENKVGSANEGVGFDGINLKNYELWIGSIEKRVANLESLLEEYNGRLYQMANKKNERDSVVLDLFKMLKNSMESRLNLVVKINQLRKQTEIKKRKNVFYPNDKGDYNNKLSMKKSKTLWAVVLINTIVIAIVVVNEFIYPLKMLIQ